MRIIEIHALQNFAPSCLNRDDVNSPKDCDFGGYRRARVSSQCQKRAGRLYFRKHQLIPPEHLSERTKRLVREAADQLVRAGKDRASAERAAANAITAVMPKTAADKNGEVKTPYLLFLGRDEIRRFTHLVAENWDALTSTPPPPPPAAAEQAPQPEKPRRGRRAGREAPTPAAGSLLPEGFENEMKGVLDGGKAADLALFGRMLADLPEQNIDAACQVAHALSTNKVHSMEMDYYTAVDDLKPDDTAGADMIGTVEFNSACFYRYANIDVDQLHRNLQQDAQLARTTVQAFLQAFVHAIPTGKQNTFAAHNAPSLIFLVVRDGQPLSLANAFVRPVAVSSHGTDSLVERSIAALDSYYARLTAMYGPNGLKAAALACMEDVPIQHLLAHPADAEARKQGSVADAIQHAVAAAFAARGAP
jgi:CRISPR system Cascade subunit CasC